MFDRLYRLRIKHQALGSGKNGELVIEGDSSRPSISVDFDSTILPCGVMSSGNIVIHGLTEDHIGKLQTIRRFDLNNNVTQNNAISLAVAWRDCKSGFTSDYTTVVQGVIVNATPGALPDRSLSIEVLLSNLNKQLDSKQDSVIYHSTNQHPVALKKWLEDAATALVSENNKGNPMIYLDVVFKGNYDGLMNYDLQYPTTIYGFQELCEKIGLKVTSQYVDGVDEDGNKTRVLRCEVFSGEEALGNSSLKSRTVVISEATGMIGMPRSIDEGAVVSVVLKDVIPCGTFVDLYSEKFSALNSKEPKYTQGGRYWVYQNRVSGRWLGDEWMQTLSLMRPDAIAEK